MVWTKTAAAAGFALTLAGAAADGQDFSPRLPPLPEPAPVRSVFPDAPGASGDPFRLDLPPVSVDPSAAADPPPAKVRPDFDPAPAGAGGAGEFPAAAPPTAGPFPSDFAGPIGCDGFPCGTRNCETCGFGDAAVAAWDPLETLTLFGGYDGAKQPQDLGVNAHFGGRVHANWGFPLPLSFGGRPLAGQAGVGLNYNDNAVRVFEALGAKTHREQLFLTGGVFQKRDGWNWSLAYDLLYQNYYDEYTVTQIRGRVGFDAGEADEVGLWGAKNDRGDDAVFRTATLTVPLRLRPISQVSAFWRHEWEGGAYTTFWGGVAEGHEETVLLLAGDDHQSTTGVVGTDFRVPLGRWVSLFGEANFLLPADTGTVDAYLGLEFSPGAAAHRLRHLPFAPLLNVANSPTFAVDVRR